jgi:hypothetical protein
VSNISGFVGIKTLWASMPQKMNNGSFGGGLLSDE